MTKLAKTFIFLTFMLSIVFFTIALGIASTHIDFKTQIEEDQATARAAQQKNASLEALKTTLLKDLEIEQVARRAALVALQRQYSDIQVAIRDQETELTGLLEQLTQLAQEGKITQEELTAKLDQNKQLRDELDTTKKKRDYLFKQVVATKDEIRQYQGQLQSLIEREQQLNERP